MGNHVRSKSILDGGLFQRIDCRVGFGTSHSDKNVYDRTILSVYTSFARLMEGK